MKTLILALALLISTQAHAYKLVLLTDEPSASKAHAIEKLILSTSPFKFLTPSEFSVEVQKVSQPVSCHSKFIKYTSAEVEGLALQLKSQGQKLSKDQRDKYRKGFAIDRLVECDRQELANIGAGFGASRVMFVHDSPYEGGSGGDIPIILSGSGAGVGLHEWLHTFGLADEYAYSEEEANVSMYCSKSRWINVAVFEARSYYASNADVIASHSDSISWLSGLPKDAVLTTGTSLGTPAGKNLGIFPAKTCSNLTPSKESWRATSYPSIMENTNVPYVPKPWWPALLSAIGVSPTHLQLMMKMQWDPYVAGLSILTEAHPQPTSGASVH